MMKVTKSDVATALAKGTLGAIPVVGSLAAEVVGMLIPNRRLDRVEKLIEELSAKLGERDPETVRERFTGVEYVDLLEEGMVQAARAISEKRIEEIASLLKNSLTDAELRHQQDKRLLQLLGELNEVELLLLSSYTAKARYDDEWAKKHDSVLRPPPAYMGAAQEDLDKATLHEQFKQHLARLGLLRPKFKSWKKGEFPEMDQDTGQPKVSYYDITALGRLLLRRVDLLGADEM
jgi:hypothetical protein